MVGSDGVNVLWNIVFLPKLISRCLSDSNNTNISIWMVVRQSSQGYCLRSLIAKVRWVVTSMN